MTTSLADQMYPTELTEAATVRLTDQTEVEVRAVRESVMDDRLLTEGTGIMFSFPAPATFNAANPPTTITVNGQIYDVKNWGLNTGGVFFDTLTCNVAEATPVS